MLESVDSTIRSLSDFVDTPTVTGLPCRTNAVEDCDLVSCVGGLRIPYAEYGANRDFVEGLRSTSKQGYFPVWRILWHRWVGK